MGKTVKKLHGQRRHHERVAVSVLPETREQIYARAYKGVSVRCVCGEMVALGKLPPERGRFAVRIVVLRCRKRRLTLGLTSSRRRLRIRMPFSRGMRILSSGLPGTDAECMICCVGLARVCNFCLDAAVMRGRRGRARTLARFLARRHRPAIMRASGTGPRASRMSRRLALRTARAIISS